MQSEDFRELVQFRQQQLEQDLTSQVMSQAVESGLPEAVERLQAAHAHVARIVTTDASGDRGDVLAVAGQLADARATLDELVKMLGASAAAMGAQTSDVAKTCRVSASTVNRWNVRH